MDNMELLKAMNEMMDANQAKVDANMKTNQEMLAKMEPRIEDNNEKFEVFQDTIVSWIDVNQVKTDANIKEMMARLEAIQAETKTDREEMLARIDTNQERMNASLKEEIKYSQAEMRSTVSALEKKMDTWIVNMKDGRKEKTACQEAIEPNLKKMGPNPGGKVADTTVTVHSYASGGPYGICHRETGWGTEVAAQGPASSC
jgi:flagellar basal body-associated protein FliL